MTKLKFSQNIQSPVFSQNYFTSVASTFQFSQPPHPNQIQCTCPSLGITAQHFKQIFQPLFGINFDLQITRKYFFLNYHFRVQKIMFGGSFSNPSNQITTQPTQKSSFSTFTPVNNPVQLFGSQSPQSNLMDRVAKVEEQYRKLKIEQENLRNQLEEYKNNPTKQQYDQLKKQLEDLKIRLENSSQNEKLRESTQPRIGLFGQTHVQQKQEEPQKQSKGEKEQLRDSIIELKKIYAKKESELDYAVAIIEKQQKTIEAQTIKISGLEMQIQNGFAKLSLQLSNMNRTLPFPSSINQVGPSSLDLNQSPQMSAPMPFPRIQKSGGSLFSDNQPNFFQQNQLSFQKRSVNPLSQSAVFENKPLNFGQSANNSNSNNNNVTYKQDGYLIKYRCINNMIHNLEISNFLGKIEVLEPIEKKYLANRRISEIVNIGSNVCEIIDHSWDNMYIKLTTFNFMNMQQMSLSERVELNKKVKQQAESTGLEYYLDGLTGNLEITSKPRPTFFKM